MGCHFLLQGIFPTQGSNLCLLHGQIDSLPLSHLGSLNLLFFLLKSTFSPNPFACRRERAEGTTPSAQMRKLRLQEEKAFTESEEG